MNTTHKLRIVGTTLLDRQLKNGNRELALFDIEVDGYVIRGCMTIAFPSGFIGFSAPRLAINRDIRAIEIRDRELRNAIVAAAVAAYHALGGTYQLKPATTPVEPRAIYPAPLVQTDDPEMKLLRDVGLADAANRPVSRRGPQLPAEIIKELERRGLTTK